MGSVGLACWLFTLVALSVARMVTGTQRYYVAPGVNRVAVMAVTAFVGYAALSGMLFPFLFAGIPVDRLDPAQPLEWGLANFAQLCYLAASFALYLIAIGRPKAELDVALNWFVRGCVVAAGIAFYQLLNAVAHVPYPSQVFYSNPSYVIFPAYQLNGMWRLNGPFTEASDMAGFMMVGISLQGWTLMHRKLTVGRVLSFLMMVFALLMTQSSVGYLVITLVCVMSVVVYLRYLWRGGELSHGKMALLLLLVCGVAVACLDSQVVGTVQKVITATLFDKQNSASYRDRTSTHETALQTLTDTWYIGAGWGSARASGLIYVLLANTGLLGVALFGCMLFSFTLPLFRGSGGVRRVVGEHRDDTEGFSLGAILFAMLMLLVTMMVAGSELGMPVLWILFGAATLATGRQSVEASRSLHENGVANVPGSRRRIFA